MSVLASPMRVLVVDDETSARKRLLQFLAPLADVEVVGESRNGREACDDIVRLQPTLVFLDVEMPELGGLDVVAQIGVDNMPATIFATAYDHYALSAFDANATDYLLKPFDQQRFDSAMDKARRWIAGAPGQLRPGLQGALASLTIAPQRILVRSGENQLMLKTADILYISAEGNYVRLHTLDRSYLMRERMAGILARLAGTPFRRIHRSHIVNLDHVTKLLPWLGGDSLVMMADGSRLTLSRNHRDALQGMA